MGLKRELARDRASFSEFGALAVLKILLWAYNMSTVVCCAWRSRDATQLSESSGCRCLADGTVALGAAPR